VLAEDEVAVAALALRVPAALLADVELVQLAHRDLSMLPVLGVLGLLERHELGCVYGGVLAELVVHEVVHDDHDERGERRQKERPHEAAGEGEERAEETERELDGKVDPEDEGRDEADEDHSGVGPLGRHLDADAHFLHGEGVRELGGGC
jgi:hypothetical protein